MRAHPIISQVMVVGDQKPFIAALVTIDVETLPAWCKEHGRPPATPVSDLCDDADLRATVQQAVDDANKAVSHAEAIKAFTILPDDFTEANGMITPSLKVKRAVVAAHYADVIATIYAGRKGD
jgi:long-chain acyl-CoA synthetase